MTTAAHLTLSAYPFKKRKQKKQKPPVKIYGVWRHPDPGMTAYVVVKVKHRSWLFKHTLLVHVDLGYVEPPNRFGGHRQPGWVDVWLTPTSGQAKEIFSAVLRHLEEREPARAIGS